MLGELALGGFLVFHHAIETDLFAFRPIGTAFLDLSAQFAAPITLFKDESNIADLFAHVDLS
jgi:hypothetical protein